MTRILRWPLRVAVLAALLLAAATASAVKPAPESYAALQKQISAHQVKTATVSPTKHTVKVKLRNNRTYVATYPASAEPTVVSSLKAGGAKVHVDRKKKASSHFRYRYIALIILAVLAIAAAAWYLIGRRRATRRPGPPPAAPEATA